MHSVSRDQVAALLRTSADGLDDEEVRRRLAEYGPNSVKVEATSRWLVVLFHQFASPLIFILLVAATVTLLLREWIDAGVIGAALALNATIGFTQERRAEASVRALMQMLAPRARVVRDGSEQEVESATLVPGDLVLLESGMRVPADLRLVDATRLWIDQSLLTGESLPVERDAHAVDEATETSERRNMAYAGSIITSGRGRGYIVATGMNTELGKIAGLVRSEESPETPLQARMTRLGHMIGVLVGVSAVGTFVLGVSLGEPVSHMFMVAVAMSVAAVPEGLPVAFTIVLALGVHRMARRNAIIRRLPAVETLGSTTVIGSDKTGTLTENRMLVREAWAGGQFFAVEPTARLDTIVLERGDREALSGYEAFSLALLTGVLANEATLNEQGQHQGDPTEIALLLHAAHHGIDPRTEREGYDTVAEMPFESERQYSASVRERAGDHILFLKGAPERVLDVCSHVLMADGRTPIERDIVQAAAEEMAARGLRVLAMAYSPLPGRLRASELLGEPSELVFLGLQGMYDPPRAGVRQAIANCQRSGMRVLMITGDHARTAQTIGNQLGIVSSGDTSVLTGAEIDELGDHQLAAALDETSIFARVSPQQKLRVVRLLQRNGEVVAVTGDGVNDAPALRAADIGVAMGRSGTDVAREAADMVLADDNFVSIYAAVEEGRVTFDNIRKVTFFLVSTGPATVLTIVGALVFGWPLPFVAAQLLWLNLATNGLQDVALVFEPGEKDILDRSPRPRREGIISAVLLERTVITAIVMAIGTLSMFRWELDRGGDLIQAQSVALTTMVLFQSFHVGNSRSEFQSLLRMNPFSNRFLLVAALAGLGLHVGALHLPVAQYVLRIEPISIDAWARMVAVAFTIVVIVEAHKLLRQRRSAMKLWPYSSFSRVRQ